MFPICLILFCKNLGEKIVEKKCYKHVKSCWLVTGFGSIFILIAQQVYIDQK